ncbi:MAG: NYN domain-containing protein [bacterium]
MDKFSKCKNYAFVDSQNLNLAIRRCGWKLDFARFFRYLKDKYNVEKAFLFIGYLPGNEALYTYLQKAGYIVIFKPTLVSKNDDVPTKGNVDAELVLHTMIEYNNYEKAIIVSGDGDFYCLIEYLEKNNKLAQVVIPNRRKYSALLRKFRGYFIYIDKLDKKLGK